MSLPPRLAFVDVESTGAHPLHDRITEIAILRVEHGKLVSTWESLVAPGVPVPPLIEKITGISDQMLVDAPSFGALADEVEQRLADCVLVAHNARFDFGFIKNAFARLGRDFDMPVLCTVKLSRALFPQYHRHGLDALIERHQLQCSARHRALGDAEVLWEFVQMARQRCGNGALQRAIEKAMKAAPPLSKLPVGVLEALPDRAGVYCLHEQARAGDENETPLFIGRALSLRSRVKEHFAATVRKGRDAELRERTQRVEWLETAGELGAMLLENRLLRQLQPPFNRQLEEREKVFALGLQARRRGPLSWQRVPLDGSDPRHWGDVHGVFRNWREASRCLQELAALYRLCPRRLGLEAGGKGACQSLAGGRCAGACVGRESLAEHDARLRAAIGGLGVKPWPWPAAVVIAEHDPEQERVAFHVFDHWCLLGTVERRDEIARLDPVRRFDVDVWRLLVRWLAAPANLATVESLSG